MPDNLFIHPDGSEQGFEAPDGVSLMQAASADLSPIVIVGAGHAAAQLCAALVAANAANGLHVVAAEAHLPYQRPPLSKAFLKSTDEPVQWHRVESWYDEHGITVHAGDAAVAIEPAAHRLRLASGRVLSYRRLVLATGAHAQGLAGLPEGLVNVHSLRGLDDAERLRAALPGAAALTIVGGGFIGLEIAATARALGHAVQVFESAPRLLARSVSPEIAEHVRRTHRAAGIDIHLDAPITGFDLDGDRVVALHTGAARWPVELLVVSVGARPETALAQAAGLACDDGIVVDAAMRSSDPAILAIGDCTRFPAHARAAGVAAGASLRLESVQNANDQAKVACATLLGEPRAYSALPWFWSEQGSLRLQMAGLLPEPAAAVQHLRPGAGANSFSVLHYVDGRLVCVESVNAPMDHLQSRRLLEAGLHPAPALACDPAVSLKSIADAPR